MDSATPGRAAGVGEEAVLSLDDTFHLLQNERRRLVLRYLLERADDAAVEMREIAEQVAAWEHGTTVTDLDSDQRQPVYVGLYQTHLPTLDSHDVIEYDQSGGWVEPTSLCAELEGYLESAPGADDGQESDARQSRDDDGQLAESRAHLLVAVVVLLPLAMIASHIGSNVVVSGALLAVILTATSVFGGSVRQYIDTLGER